MSARCPRCTPSKLPIVSAHRPGARCKEPCVTTMDSVKTLNYSALVKTLEEEMATYAAYHQDPRNKATHFVGVPLIMLATLIPLSIHRFELMGFSVTPAVLLAAALLPTTSSSTSRSRWRCWRCSARPPCSPGCRGGGGGAPPPPPWSAPSFAGGGVR